MGSPYLYTIVLPINGRRHSDFGGEGTAEIKAVVIAAAPRYIIEGKVGFDQ